MIKRILKLFVSLVLCLYGFSIMMSHRLYSLDLENTTSQQIFAGGLSSFYIDEDKQLWAWGDNEYGQLGDGTATKRTKPVLIMSDVVSVSSAISTSFSHTLALKSDGSLWSWGDNLYGQLGRSTSSTHKYLPGKVMDNVIKMAANGVHSFAITTDNVLWGWGSNWDSQLGTIKPEDKTNHNYYHTPVQLMEDVIDVSTGRAHTLAIKSDGSLWTWGSNYYGQLGDGTTVERIAPLKIMEDVSSISTGSYQSFAIKTDGSLLAWGYNQYGELGDGTSSNQLIPVKTMEDISSVVAGHGHGLAIKSDDTLWSWGWNGDGQLGDGSRINKISPIHVFNNVAYAVAGVYHSLMQLKDGSVYVWGANWDNQFGNETTTPSYVPLMIIDKTPPIITVEDYVTTPTNQDITVTVSTNEGTLNKTSHTFTENGSFNFIATDEAGNVSEETITITNIDKIAPVITVGEYTTTPTNQDITVFVSTNEGTLNKSSHTFTENGSFTFIATDEVGNVTEKTIIITNIDKIAPVITVGEYTTTPTNQDITVTVSTNEGTLNKSSHTFTENGSFTFVATDAAGNVTEVTVTISNIDKIAPIVTGVQHNKHYNSNRIITFDDGNATLNGINFDSGSTISQEGVYRLIVTDIAGNTTLIDFTIDKTAPVITVLPYSTELTHLPVTVSVTTNEGTLNKTSHTFNQNGSFTFIATDEAGNVTEETVTISHMVNANDIKHVELISGPTRVQYLRGQILDLSGGVIRIETYGGSSTTTAITASMISGYNPYSSTYGPQTITVTYAGKTTTFEVYLNRFIDVPYGHRNYAHINTLVELGIINGYSDSTFRPNNTLTRAQAAIMIARAIGLSTEGVSSNFSDVPSTHAAYKFISAAQNAGIINGYSDGTFRPNASITRAQIAIMVQRAFQVQASGTTISFSDVPVGYAPKSFIETLASQRIVNGYSDGTFKPTSNITRAQFSTMINNAIEYSKKR